MTGEQDQTVDAPKAIDLEEFLRILPYLDSPDLLAMSAAYQQADPDAREAARQSASAISKKRGLTEELGRLQGSIIQWAGSNIAASGIFTFESVGFKDRLLGDVRSQAVPPLLDTATALLLGDALGAEEHQALMEPWRSALG